MSTTILQQEESLMGLIESTRKNVEDDQDCRKEYRKRRYINSGWKTALKSGSLISQGGLEGRRLDWLCQKGSCMRLERVPCILAQEQVFAKVACIHSHGGCIN
jgi:hypothetical protein